MLSYKVSICDLQNNCKIVYDNFDTEKEFLSWLDMIKRFHPDKNVTYEKVESEAQAQ